MQDEFNESIAKIVFEKETLVKQLKDIKEKVNDTQSEQNLHEIKSYGLKA